MVGILEGVNVISILGIKDDMMNVGVIWYNEFVVIDGYIILSCCLLDFLEYLLVFIFVLED